MKTLAWNSVKKLENKKLTWSHILSGCPSETDSEVKRKVSWATPFEAMIQKSMILQRLEDSDESKNEDRNLYPTKGRSSLDFRKWGITRNKSDLLVVFLSSKGGGIRTHHQSGNSFLVCLSDRLTINPKIWFFCYQKPFKDSDFKQNRENSSLWWTVPIPGSSPRWWLLSILPCVMPF